MYAIILAGGKQYRVEPGAIIDIDLVDLEAGSKVTFDKVLFVYDGEATRVGQPTVSGYVVTAELVEEEVFGPKVIAYKYKRRKNQARKVGHRQRYSRVKINEISAEEHHKHGHSHKHKEGKKHGA